MQEIVASGDGLLLHTPEETFHARFLVGADGANGQIRRLSTQGSWFSQGFALEVQTPKPLENVDLTFDFAAVPGATPGSFPSEIISM